MQKSYCDLCGEEIKEMAPKGVLIRQKIVFPFVPGAPGGPQGGMIPRQGLMDEINDLCPECQKWIFDLFEKKKEELSKKI